MSMPMSIIIYDYNVGLESSKDMDSRIAHTSLLVSYHGLPQVVNSCGQPYLGGSSDLNSNSFPQDLLATSYLQ